MRGFSSWMRRNLAAVALGGSAMMVTVGPNSMEGCANLFDRYLGPVIQSLQSDLEEELSAEWPDEHDGEEDGGFDSSFDDSWL